MKVLFVVVALAVAVSAAPGGYTGNGGVYFNPEAVDQLDYMDHARHAGKFAWSKKFESELVQTNPNQARDERNAAYVPTFFTSQQNHAALAAARPSSFGSQARSQREVPEGFEAPLYYNTFNRR